MKLIEKLKDQKIYYIQHFEENSNNIKKIWSVIREIMNIKYTISPKLTQLNVNGKTIVNPKEIATNLNDFFVNIGPSTELNIPKAVNINPKIFLKTGRKLTF